MTTTTTPNRAAAVNRNRQNYPFWLGGVAASVASSITHPLDLIKVRLQASGDHHAILQSIRKTVARAGVRGLWDGVSATLLRHMTYSLARFSVYEEAKKRIAPGDNNVSGLKLAVCGSIAGTIGGIVGNPADIILVRMQTDDAKLPAKRFYYKHCFDGLSRMIREEGPSSLARGILPNTTRSILMNSSQIPAYDWSKSSMIGQGWMDDGPLCHFFASFFAATVATTVCAPADVLKSRLMNAASNQSTLHVLKESILHEGPRVLFRGWLPAWVRLQPTTILTFLVLEQLRRVVDLSQDVKDEGTIKNV